MAHLSIHPLLVLLLSNEIHGQVFNAYDCSEPKDVRLLSHQKCLEEKAHVTQKTFFVLQENFRRNTTGYMCEVKTSEQIDYCGHYREVLTILLT